MRSLPTATLLFLSASLVAQSGWTTPVLETVLNSTASDSGPHLSIDGTTLHFASFSSGNWEIWSATRPGPGAPWSAPVAEPLLGDLTATDDQPFLAADLLEIYFASTRAGGAGSFDILRSTRTGIGQPWSTPTFVTEINSASADSAPSLTADGLEIYFLTTGWGSPSGNNNQIFRATRPNTASPFGTPTLVTELSNANTHRDCEIAADGLSITYTEFTNSRLEVLFARRTSRSAAFDPPVILSEFSGVGTLSGVFSFTRSLDGHEAILAAGFAVAAGSQELMSTTFEGLTQTGGAGIGQTMSLLYRDSANPGKFYVYGAALGTTGFPIGARTIPLDPDWLLSGTLGQSIPPFTTGWVGTLDAGGNAAGSLSNVLPFLTGFRFHVGALTFDPAAPFGVATISNTIAVEFQ